MSQPAVSITARRIGGWLDQPLSPSSCVLGWCVATAVFMGLVAVLGGIAASDTYESVFSTWAIAHGQMACAFPNHFRLTAPLYPLFSGGIAAIARIGHAVPFPQRSVMGPHCYRAFLAINTWSLKTRAEPSTLKIAYLSWPVLLVGAVVLLRAIGRGRRGWEPATLIVLACLPPVWTCIQSTFHPEDLFAMGFALAAVACALRGSWVAAGILIGLAVLSQQYAILVAAPLLILAPARRRVAYSGATVLTVAAVAAPLIAMSSVSVIHSIFLGTGTTGGVGGAVVWELGLHGVPLILLSRIVPLGLSVMIAWWTVRRLGPAGALKPVVVLSVVAVSLSLRLVFEQQIFEYYFMALAVALVLLDVVRGHIRGSLVAWLLIVPTVSLQELVLPTHATNLVPLFVTAIAMVVIVAQALRGGPRSQLVPWIAVAVASVISWNESFALGSSVTWFWQLALVVPGVLLAARPLLNETRRHRAEPQVQGVVVVGVVTPLE